jgi:hypothetical protein
VGNDAKVPLAHRFEHSHLLYAVQTEVLELQPLREQHPTNEPVGGDGETALVERHERHHVSRGRARHGLIDGNDPLDGIDERRKLTCLDQAEEILMGDIGARLVRHHDGEV